MDLIARLRRKKTQAVAVPLEGERIVVRPSRPSIPSVAICSLATGQHRKLLAESGPTLLELGERLGWTVVLSCELLSTRPTSWSKLKLIESLLGEFEFVFWIDADAIVVDLSANILGDIGPDSDAWFVRHPQQRREDQSVLNAGVFLVRRSAFVADLLDAIWKQDDLIDHNWWENAALLRLLGFSLEPPYERVADSPWMARVSELDLRWNSVPEYCESPRPAINHHARADHGLFERRLKAMQADRIAVMGPASTALPIRSAGDSTRLRKATN